MAKRAHDARAARSDRAHQHCLNFIATQKIGKLGNIRLHVFGPAATHEGVVELRHRTDDTLGFELAHAVGGE